ncbi:MAG: spheroidene monooxygenase [Amaricoccus sp.]
MLFARRSLARAEGIEFWKLLGSGTGEGFTPIPNTAIYAILAAWSDGEQAWAQVSGAQPFRRYRARAREAWTIFLVPITARGAWSGVAPFVPAKAAEGGPLAALTRATVRPSRLARFWSRVPKISRRIGDDPNVLFKIGVGEVPWLHQVTFSIWPDEASMAAFARRDGPHARAIRAVREGGWFAEELYARFRVVGEAGTWGGLRLMDRRLA